MSVDGQVTFQEVSTMDMSAWSVLSHISRLKLVRTMESSFTASDTNTTVFAPGSSG